MKKLFTLFFSFTSLISLAQSGSVAYSRDYEFTEGIYLTVNQFYQNTPILKSSIVSNIPKSEIDFLKQIMEQKNIVFKDTDGKEKNIETSRLWGYCQNRSVYIKFYKELNEINLVVPSPIIVNKEFRRLHVIGTLCHFTATVLNPLKNDTNPTGQHLGSAFPYTMEELGQFVFDTQTNKVLEFDVTNMEMLLKNDDQLYNQFMALKRRQKQDAIFVYLRKYNDKHPLYLPLK